MLNHYDLGLYVGWFEIPRDFIGLPELYGLKCENLITSVIFLYLCSYNLDGSVTAFVFVSNFTAFAFISVSKCKSRKWSRGFSTVSNRFHPYSHSSLTQCNCSHSSFFLKELFSFIIKHGYKMHVAPRFIDLEAWTG
jgi:hypothetical protein